MDVLQSDRCISEELDPSLQHWIKTCCHTHSASDANKLHTTDSQVREKVSVAELHTLSTLRKKNQELLYINQKWAEQYRTVRLECKHREVKLRSGLHEAGRQIQCLRTQCETLTRKGQQQEQEIRQLKKDLIEVQKNSVSQKDDAQGGQDIWMYQAQVYKEDFLKERKDKERLKEKCIELENRFKRSHAQVLWTPSPHT